MNSIVVAARLLARFEAAAARSAPTEALALLIGLIDAEKVSVVELEIVANTAEDPERRFRLAPRDWVVARRRAQGEGLDIVGLVHAHPRGPARLSDEDRAALARLHPVGPSWPMLLCTGDPTGRWTWSCWRLNDLSVESVSICIT